MQQRARERRQTKILLCSFTPIFPSFSLLTSIHCLRSCFSCFITKHKRKVHQKTLAKQAKPGFCCLKHILVLLSALPGWVVSPSLIAPRSISLVPISGRRKTQRSKNYCLRKLHDANAQTWTSIRIRTSTYNEFSKTNWKNRAPRNTESTGKWLRK